MLYSLEDVSWPLDAASSSTLAGMNVRGALVEPHLTAALRAREGAPGLALVGEEFVAAVHDLRDSLRATVECGRRHSGLPSYPKWGMPASARGLTIALLDLGAPTIGDTP